MRKTLGQLLLVALGAAAFHYVHSRGVEEGHKQAEAEADAYHYGLDDAHGGGFDGDDPDGGETLEGEGEIIDFEERRKRVLN